VVQALLRNKLFELDRNWSRLKFECKRRKISLVRFTCKFNCINCSTSYFFRSSGNKTYKFYRT